MGKSSKKISHKKDPRNVVLEEEEWNAMFKETIAHRQAVKLALAPAKSTETNDLEKDIILFTYFFHSELDVLVNRVHFFWD